MIPMNHKGQIRKYPPEKRVIESVMLKSDASLSWDEVDAFTLGLDRETRPRCWGTVERMSACRTYNRSVEVWNCVVYCGVMNFGGLAEKPRRSTSRMMLCRMIRAQRTVFQIWAIQ